MEKRVIATKGTKWVSRIPQIRLLATKLKSPYEAVVKIGDKWETKKAWKATKK